MENMLAAELNHRLLPQALHVAYYTVGVRVLSMSHRFVLSDAIFMQARRVLLLVGTAIARVAAIQELIAAPPCLLLALSLRAVVLPCVSEHCATKSALLSVLVLLELSAVLAHMVRLGLAADTEVVSALRTPDTVRAHMFGSSLVDLLALIILVLVDNFSLGEFNGVTALASHKVLVLIKHCV